MTIVKQAIVELILLTVASVGVALAANAIRERKSIDLTKNNFPSQAVSPPAAAPNAVESKVGPLKDPNVVAPVSAKPAIVPLQPDKSTDPKARVPSKHLEHEFQTITLDEVKKTFDDPNTKQGLNVFVDARDDEHFAEGHIPGAIQCFPYEIKRCLDRVKAAANGAEKVVVYCEGGDCEDSIFMCRELVEAGVPSDAVFLFEGGWKEWSARKLPVEGGK